MISTQLAEQCGSWTLGQCDVEYKAWVGCSINTVFAQNGFDCQVDCDAVKGKDSDGALGLTTTLAATAVAVAAAF